MKGLPTVYNDDFHVISPKQKLQKDTKEIQKNGQTCGHILPIRVAIMVRLREAIGYQIGCFLHIALLVKAH